MAKTEQGSDKEVIDIQEQLKNVNQFVKEQYQELQTQIQDLKATNRKQQLIIDNQAAKLKQIENLCAKKSDEEWNKNKVRRQFSETVVAFSATINQAHVDSIGLHQNIVFSDVITNIGNAYNNHHGVFIAPVSGLYMFSATLLSSQNAELAAAIEINGTDAVRMFEKGADGRHGSASQTIIIKLRKGDDVSIQSVFSDSHSYWGDKYTSFSGVLLHEMEMDTSQILGRK